MGRVTKENVERVFTYIPWDEEQRKQGSIVTDAIMNLATVILSVVPDCSDRTTAIRKLRELRMDVNAAISLRGEI